MEDEWKIKKGRKIRISTYSSDFEGIVEEYTSSDNYLDSFLGLIDAEEVYDSFYNEVCGNNRSGCLRQDGEWEIQTNTGREEYRRSIGKIRIPLDKINHYEYLGKEEHEHSDSRYCTECGSKL